MRNWYSSSRSGWLRSCSALRRKATILFYAVTATVGITNRLFTTPMGCVVFGSVVTNNSRTRILV